MAVDFQSKTYTFPSHSGSAQNQDQTFVFSTNIPKAEAAIKGFSFEFTSAAITCLDNKSMPL